MATHLYLCDLGGPMTLAIDGTAPQWVTCPVGGKSLECTSCPSAQLQGEAAPFPAGETVRYRCPAGHVRAFTLPVGVGRPESAHCPDCGGMLLAAPA